MRRQERMWLSALIRSIPNALSVGRLALGLAFVFIPAAWRVPIVVIAAATDLLDGTLSRRLHASTTSGRLLDPLADKVFASAVVVALVGDGTLALWQALLVCLRDVLVLVGIVVLLLRPERLDWDRLRPTLLGKIVTAAQFVFFLSLLVFSQTFLVLFIATAGLSVAAAVDYSRRFVAYASNRVGDVHSQSASRQPAGGEQAG